MGRLMWRSFKHLNLSFYQWMDVFNDFMYCTRIMYIKKILYRQFDGGRGSVYTTLDSESGDRGIKSRRGK